MPKAESLRLAKKVQETVLFARKVREMKRDNAATELWRHVYHDLSEGKSGLAGAVVNRAEAQVLRLSMIYALLDLSAVIKLEHLQAALALWERCEQSARFIFGHLTGNPYADEILRLLKSSGQKTQTEINNHLGRHVPAHIIKTALEQLSAAGLVEYRSVPTKGRTKIYWYAKKAN